MANDGGRCQEELAGERGRHAVGHRVSMIRRPVGMAMPVQHQLQAVLGLVVSRVRVVVLAVVLMMVGGYVQHR